MDYEKILAAFKGSITTCLQKYFIKDGRASRPEFWYFSALTFVLANMSAVISIPFITIILLIPSIMAAIRRLHDTDKSGYWVLLGFIPIFGQLAMIWLLIQKGTNGDNQYGRKPTENTSFGFHDDDVVSGYQTEEFNRDKYEHTAEDEVYHQTIDNHSGEIKFDYENLPGDDDAPTNDGQKRDRYGRIIGESKSKRKKNDDFLEG